MRPLGLGLGLRIGLVFSLNRVPLEVVLEVIELRLEFVSFMAGTGGCLGPLLDLAFGVMVTVRYALRFRLGLGFGKPIDPQWGYDQAESHGWPGQMYRIGLGMVSCPN